VRCTVAGFAAFPELIARLGRLPAAFASGRGVSWDERGPEAVVSMERRFAAWYRTVLVPVALPRLDGVVPRLAAGGTAADVGCGTGVALLAMAQAFPRSRFHGYETSRNALARAEQNRARAGVSDVHFHHAQESPLPADGRFDLITTFDCVHDMTRPAEVAQAIRAALAPEGTWFIADINGQPTFEENLAANPMAASAYSISVLGCLSAGMSEPDGAGLGTPGLPEPAMRALAEAPASRASGGWRFPPG
jgi:SAM-dependent methyltransferase